jgi:hypothetical protein
MKTNRCNCGEVLKHKKVAGEFFAYCPKCEPMHKVEVFQCPASHKWFICHDGLMDVDAGYFDSKELALTATQR